MSETENAPRPRILVVDDHAELTALVAAWLADIGDIYTATTSAQALALADALLPDLAIVDVILPGIDGFQVVDALRQHPELADVPVIIITGSERQDIGMRAFGVHAAVVLYKPLDEAVLVEAVRTLLRARAPRI